MNPLKQLVHISRYYGNDPGYVIAGGGNTSYKTETELYIKASGISLASIDENGFVKMSREKLKQIEQATFPADPSEREHAVKLALGKAVISPENLRPSVETSLHNLIEYPFIVHTHPTLVNAVMCAQHAKEVVEERFGSDAIFMAYTDPGYILFKELKQLVRAYESDHGKTPRIIFLQNHGVFVGAKSIEDVSEVYLEVESRIREGKDLALPGSEPEVRTSGATLVVDRFMKNKNLITTSFRSPLIDHFAAGDEMFERISRPFTPDIIVYCKSNYLYLRQGAEKELILRELGEFETRYGHLPRVIIEEQGGLIIAGENDQSVRTVLEVFTDMMKISYLSEQFGGPHFMTEEQIAFIDNWEVENYRRSVARNTR